MAAKRTLNILHIAAPGIVGGLESVVIELTAGLSAAGHRTALAAVLSPGAEDHPVPTRAAELGVQVHRVMVPPRSYSHEYRQLQAVIDTVRPDLVHTHGYRADLIGGLVATRSGVPWVSTVHGFTGGDQKNRFYEWLQVRSYRRATALAAVSRPIRERLMRAGVSEHRIRVLPNAWAAKKILKREEARSRLGIEGTAPVIGWVGRVTRPKGPDVFLEALALLQQGSWRASIIGDGKERSALEAQAERSGVADRISWHGLIQSAAELYSAFDVFVLSSRTEGTPIALFEAMAARVPVVVTTVGGVPDVVSPSEALLVEAEHPAALAAAIDSIIADPGQAAARAEAAYLRLAQDFSTERWLDAHVALYRTIVLSREARYDC